MSATPASEQSLYFDVPIANFHSPTSPMMMKTDSPAHPPPDAGGATYDKEKHDMQNDVPLLVPNSGPVADAATEASKDGVIRKDSVLISSLPTTRSNSPPIGSPERGMFINADGQVVAGSTFIAGAATTGPYSTAEADGQLHRRAASADASLTPKQRSKIEKSEAKDGKRLSKIIKEEAKAEKKALSVALNELAELQKLQKQAIKTEEKAHSTHTKVLSQLQQEEKAFLAARSKYEAAQARLRAEEEALEIVRTSARDLMQRLQQKAQEVDSVRKTYAVDERERVEKLAELAKHSSRCF